MSELTGHRRHLLRQALGLNIADEPYRNWFASGPKDLADWQALVEMGLAEHAKRTKYDNFVVTKLGILAASSPPPAEGK